MKRILVIRLPNWPLQRRVSARPELKGQPLVLQHATRRGQCVAACCRAARRLGIRPGMPIAEAAALARSRGEGSAPDETSWHLEQHDPAADRAALEKLAFWCQQFSPLVGLEEADEPAALLLDVTGLAGLFGGETALVRRVVCQLAQRHLIGQVAVADTIGAAWAAAHFSRLMTDGVAHVDVPRPEALPSTACLLPAVVVLPGQSRLALAPLPVEALRLDGSTADTLHQLGIDRVADLLALPRASLSCRFGPLLIRRLDQALGTAAETFRPVHPPPEFTARWSLEYPTARRDTLQHVLEHLVSKLTLTLAQRNRGALELSCRLDCSAGQLSALPYSTDCSTDCAPLRRHVAWQISLFRPSAEARHLLELIRTTFERVALPGPVTEVELRATRHAPLQRRQLELLDEGRWRLDSPEFAALVDRLAGRLGPQTVAGCCLRAEAQPELAWRARSLVRPKSAGGSQQLEGIGPLDRPLFLLSKPLPVQVVAVAPEGLPVRLWLGGQQHHVARRWGPERIETGWWRRRTVRRDYYRVETTSGQRFWVFRRVDDGRWFLHGRFE